MIGVYTLLMPTYLLKTEPGTYSFDDLVHDKHAVWDGVSNAAALIALRSMKKGDDAFIYHTGDEKQIVGMAVVTKAAYPDPDQDDEKLVVVELKPGKRAKEPVTLARIKSDPRFKEFALVKQSRLSVMPVPAAMEKIIREWAGL